MSVIQPNLIIPPQFQIRIDAGELSRDGGVLRRTIDGTIALILKDGPAPVKDVERIQSVAADTVKRIDIGKLIKNHKGAVTVGIIGLIVTIGTGIYLYVDKKKSDKVMEDTACNVSEFQTALSNYLKLAMGGKLRLIDIDRLIIALDKLENGPDREKNIIDFSAGELSTLVSCIIEYTRTLAEANSYELDDSYSDKKCTFINLRHHLDAQKTIFENASQRRDKTDQ
ncbi:MAG TPA: hypothetical protein VM577_09640 [Anaerovoracaceae bacterium]|nr:hypothetical protein [Anaerovoracaceae bacterium]